jgi:hypothetical protein
MLRAVNRRDDACEHRGAAVLADDFAADLDAASGEFLAAALLRAGGRVWFWNQPA